MKKIVLTRSIKNAAGTEDILEINMKEESEMNAYDFYDVEFGADGKVALGAMAPAIANLCNLTSEQVSNLHIKDFMSLSADVGKYIS